MPGTCKKDRYALARYRDGLTDSEACEVAGYTQAPASARQLWRAMESMARTRDRWCDVEHYEQRVSDLSARLSEARTLLRAARLLQSADTSGGEF